ncbi:MAG: protein kinase [Chloroflexota bacterium]
MGIAPGSNLGPYQILEQIGRGGMATVFRAYQPALERQVAVKVLPEFFADEPGFKERFHREAVAVARFQHPNILTVYDHGEQDGVSYIVNEYIEGGTLQQRVGPAIEVGEVVRLLEPVAAALDYAHRRGIVHRDVKPSNILIRDDGTPVLGDFGLARMMDSQARLTVTGTVIGTPEYMSPEECAGLGSTPASDQYSLAVVAFELLTGRVPFEAETPAAVIIAQISSPLPHPRELNPGLSPAVETALLRALAREPADRFANCLEFMNALASTATEAVPAEPTPTPNKALVPGAAVTSGPPPATVGSAAPPSHRPRLIAFSAALLLAGVAVVGALAVSHWPAKSAARDVAASPSAPVTPSSSATPLAPQVTEPAMPAARQETAAAALGDTLYVIAGKDSSGAATNSVFVFKGGGWSAGPSLPIPLDHAAAAALGGFLYVSGGFSNGPPSARVFRLNGSVWAEVAPMKRARGGHALVVVSTNAYALGGADAAGDVAIPESYDPSTNKWSDLAPLPAPRNHVSGFAYRGSACIAGGRTPLVARVDCYDPGLNAWSRLPDLPVATSGAGAGTLGDEIVVAGGENPQTQALINQVARYRGGAWSSEGMLVPRHGLALAAFGGRLWACGGGSQSLVHPTPDCSSIS